MPDKTKEDTTSKKLNTLDKKLSTLDKYISVTYKMLHFAVITIYTVLLLCLLTLLDQQYIWYLFMMAAFIFTITLIVIYTFSKKKRQPHRVKMIHKILYVSLSVIWMILIAMAAGLFQAALMYKNMQY